MIAATHAPDADAAWTAVLARDRAADGRFVYAVTSTGIFCRPSCPSRRPRRDRVRFFAAPAEAAAAGFRPCRRCLPTAAVRSLAERARLRLDAADDGALPLATLARELGTTPSHLQRAFTKEMGLSPRAYLERRRAERLRGALRRGDAVSRAIYDAGFASHSRGYAAAERALGMPPGKYRAGGRGLVIEFGLTASRLGRLLVARTARGVCAVLPGADDRACLAALRAEFPAAELAEAGTPFAELALVRDAIDRGAAARPALDLQGTEFQRLVWAALERIPRGETRTYSEVARAIGRPDAVRAVAGACAANRVAVVVPCHRVVREDGGLGGYKWGLERKATLLAAEGARDA